MYVYICVCVCVCVCNKNRKKATIKSNYSKIDCLLKLW